MVYEYAPSILVLVAVASCNRIGVLCFVHDGGRRFVSCSIVSLRVLSLCVVFSRVFVSDESGPLGVLSSLFAPNLCGFLCCLVSVLDDIRG